MDRTAVRFVRTAAALADRHVGLEWEPTPSDVPVTWDEALATVRAGGWRLPTASELMGFLGDAPPQAIWLPPAGTTFWSATGSPFDRGDRIRAVSRAPGGRFVVVLLEKAERARRWGVRSARI
jgi:hypothetical protein